MKDTYRGETYIKSVNRVIFWEALRDRAGIEHFLSGKFLILASREAGDISCLLGCGVSPKNIVGVEINPVAAEQARQKYPDVTIITGDIVDVVKKYHKHFDFAYLDVCGCAGEGLIELFTTVIRWGMKSRSYVGWTVQVGRENELDKLKEMKKWARIHTNCTIKATGSTPPPHYLKRYENAKARMIWLAREVWDRLDVCNYMLRLEMFGGYHSGHTPMITVLYSIERFPCRITMKKSVRLVVKDMETSDPESSFLWEVSEDHFRQMVLYATNFHATDQVAKIFNISSGRVAAWKAHQTRGTYDGVGRCADEVVHSLDGGVDGATEERPAGEVRGLQAEDEEAGGNPV